MSRLNLICNGMMFFNEVGDRLQIVIPDIEGHVRMFCSDPKPTKDKLRPLPVGRYELAVPASNKTPLRYLLDGSGYVLLDGRKVNFDEERAKPISAIIDVPKPDIIRLYRASEPLSLDGMLGNCRESVVRTPTVAHDIVVLSYTKIPDGTAVGLAPTGSSAVPLATTRMAELAPISWIVYSNEKTPFALDFDAVRGTDQQYAEAMAASRHPTALNDFLTVNIKAAQAGVGTTLQLSGIGKKDGPPTIRSMSPRRSR